MTFRLTPLLALSLLGLAAGVTSAVAAADEKLKAAAEQEKAPLIETLRDMVMIESGSGDAEGLKKMADFTEARLKALGAVTERRKTTAGTGADMVIATFKGSGTRNLMLIAHMDTVYQRGVLAASRTALTATASMAPASPTTRAASPWCCMRSRY